MQYEIIITS